MNEKMFNILAIIVWLAVVFCIIFLVMNGSKNIDYDNDFVFKCNPHYFGPQYAYPNPECNDSFINVTGNYCNGELVCENQLRD